MAKYTIVTPHVNVPFAFLVHVIVVDLGLGHPVMNKHEIATKRIKLTIFLLFIFFLLIWKEEN